MVFKLLVFVLGLFLVTIAHSGDLKPFVSDGCSAFPDGTLEQGQLWPRCCSQHDYAYWKGGTYEESLRADQVLKVCVDAVGEPEIALLMLIGVRVGGTPYLPTAFRWGYGWNYPRLYEPLSIEELRQLAGLVD